MYLPKHVKMTKREFQKQKRIQFKNLCRYIEISGITGNSGYLPELQYYKLIKGIELIREAKKDLHSWWKWA